MIKILLGKESHLTVLAIFFAATAFANLHAQSMDDAIYSCNYMMKLNVMVTEGMPEPCQFVINANKSATENLPAYAMHRLAKMRFAHDPKLNYASDFMAVPADLYPDAVRSEYFNLFAGYSILNAIDNKKIDFNFSDVSGRLERHIRDLLVAPDLDKKAKASGATVLSAYIRATIFSGDMSRAVKLMGLMSRAAPTIDDEFYLFGGIFSHLHPENVNRRALYKEMVIKYGEEDWRPVMLLIAVNATPRLPRFTISGQQVKDDIQNIPSMLNLYQKWIKSDLVSSVPASSRWFIDRINQLYQRKEYAEAEVLLNYLLSCVQHTDIGALNHKRLINMSALLSIKRSDYSGMRSTGDTLLALWKKRYWDVEDDYIYPHGLL